MSRFSWAPTAFKKLSGVFCIFKPTGIPAHSAVEIIKNNLAGDLNNLPCYEHEIPLQHPPPLQENVIEKALRVDVVPDTITDWSEHRLVLGPRYESSDFNIRFVDGISRHTSGVLVLSIGSSGQNDVSMIAQSKFLRVYHVKGRFGWATDNFSPKGKILERTSFKHVTRSKLEKVCAAAQAAYTRQMYSLSGVDPDSQEAYELATAGIIRPAHRHTSPCLYGIKCIDFQPPDFTLEIHSINEKCILLRRLIHDLAIKLKSTAVCTGIRRLRYGHFDLRRALLRQHWHLDNIIDNLAYNQDLLLPEKLFVGMKAEKTNLLPPTSVGGFLPFSSAIGNTEHSNMSSAVASSNQVANAGTVANEQQVAVENPVAVSWPGSPSAELIKDTNKEDHGKDS